MPSKHFHLAQDLQAWVGVGTSSLCGFSGHFPAAHVQPPEQVT